MLKYTKALTEAELSRQCCKALSVATGYKKCYINSVHLPFTIYNCIELKWYHCRDVRHFTLLHQTLQVMVLSTLPFSLMCRCFFGWFDNNIDRAFFVYKYPLVKNSCKLDWSWNKQTPLSPWLQWRPASSSVMHCGHWAQRQRPSAWKVTPVSIHLLTWERNESGCFGVYQQNVRICTFMFGCPFNVWVQFTFTPLL